jgi:hypothetical protein
MTDILFDDTGDVLIKQGDIVLGDATYQNLTSILKAAKGCFKFEPFAGLGAENYINDDFTESEFISRVQAEIEADGFVLTSLQIARGSLKLDGYYGKAKRSYNQNTAKSPSGILNKYALKDGQSIFDLAMIFYANIEGVYRIMEINGLSDFPPVLREGQTLFVDQNAINRTSIYGNVSERLATMPALGAGIGNMEIGSTFII